MWRYSTHKKTAGAVVRYVCQRAAKPGTRFMRCSGNVTRLIAAWQAVFLCVHDDHSVRQQFVQQGVGGGPAVVEVKRRIIADVHLHRDVDVFRDYAERHVASVA